MYEAIADGYAQCAADWGQPEEEIKMLGIAKGDVEILAWDDEEGL